MVLRPVTRPLSARVCDLLGIGPLKVLQDECSYEVMDVFLEGGLGGDEAEDLIHHSQLEAHVDGTVPEDREDAGAYLRLQPKFVLDGGI